MTSTTMTPAPPGAGTADPPAASPSPGIEAPAPVPSLTAVAAEADRWLRRFRAILAALLGGIVAGIGALAFYTSFEAIRSYAQRSGGITPAHAWAVPLLVDSFIVVATGADLWFSTTTKRQRHLWELWWPRVLMIGAAAVSFVLNVAHAERGDWAARGVAAIPPAALVLGVELLMLVLRRATTLRAERLAAAAASGKQEVASPPRVEVSRGDSPVAPALPAPPKSRAARSRRSGGDKRPAPKSQQAREFVLGEWAEGRRPTGGEIDRRFQVSEGYGRRLLRDLAVTTNGQHPPTSEEGQS